MSERSDIADRFAKLIDDAGMNMVCGGYVLNHKRYYAVGFDIPRYLDGEVRVYSPKFIMVRYQAPGQYDSLVFESEANAAEFMRLAFVENDKESAYAVPTKKQDR